jgi:hypothetical protein
VFEVCQQAHEMAGVARFAGYGGEYGCPSLSLSDQG